MLESPYTFINLLCVSEVTISILNLQLISVFHSLFYSLFFTLQFNLITIFGLIDGLTLVVVKSQSQLKIYILVERHHGMCHCQHNFEDWLHSPSSVSPPIHNNF